MAFASIAYIAPRRHPYIESRVYRLSDLVKRHWHAQLVVMAGPMASCGFAVLTYVLIIVCSFLTLLRVIFVILLHPFQALKKTPRDGKGGRDVK